MRKSDKIKFRKLDQIPRLEPSDLRLYHKCEPLLDLIQDLALEVIDLRYTINSMGKQLYERFGFPYENR